MAARDPYRRRPPDLGASPDLERRAAVWALHRGVNLHEGLTDRAEDGRPRRRLLLVSLPLHLGGNLAEVERGRAAVEADVSRLRDPVVQVGATRIDVNFREQRAKELATTAARAHEQHGCSLRNDAVRRSGASASR